MTSTFYVINVSNYFQFFMNKSSVAIANGGKISRNVVNLRSIWFFNRYRRSSLDKLIGIISSSSIFSHRIVVGKMMVSEVTFFHSLALFLSLSISLV